jgi:primosomal protein N' (replication factor Y)
MGVYHSRFSDDERVELWQAVREKKISFVVGVRSSIFLPFADLGLVIIDEEHETSYKQFEKSPLYHGRDLALVLAHFHQSKALLGSATPSVESYHLAQNGQYGMVKLLKRFGDAALPEIKLVDLKTARSEKAMKGFFSNELLTAVGSALAQKEQVILFQNRRGYSPYMQCGDCSWVPKCVNCSVSLTYHQRETKLKCHYCGHFASIPDTCSACGSDSVHIIGYGTERIEDELKIHFPEAGISRMDKDTTSGKNDFERIIEDFENHESDILVGTQMITKGLDFAKVNLVGVFDIDRMLNFPDFRAEERVFQLLMQVSGRAGRKSGKGLVLIQTTNPEQKVFEFLTANSYEKFFEREIEQRNQHFFPPFSRIIKITVKAEEFSLCDTFAHEIAKALKKNYTILGPESGLVERIRNNYIQNILIKLPRAKFDLKNAKNHILSIVNHYRKLPDAKKIHIVLDADPV